MFGSGGLYPSLVATGPGRSLCSGPRSQIVGSGGGDREATREMPLGHRPTSSPSPYTGLTNGRWRPTASTDYGGRGALSVAEGAKKQASGATSVTAGRARSHAVELRTNHACGDVETAVLATTRACPVVSGGRGLHTIFGPARRRREPRRRSVPATMNSDLAATRMSWRYGPQAGLVEDELVLGLDRRI